MIVQYETERQACLCKDGAVIQQFADTHHLGVATPACDFAHEKGVIE